MNTFFSFPDMTLQTCFTQIMMKNVPQKSLKNFKLKGKILNVLT